MTPIKAWIILIMAGLLEPLWITLMIKGDGLNRPIFVLLGGLTIALEFGLFNYALNSLPINVAYFVWVAISAISVFVLSWYMGENIHPLKIFSFFLILMGIFGIKYSS